MENPTNKSAQEEIAEMETQQKKLESSLEALKAKIEAKKKELETTAENATTIPEHQKNQIINDGGTLEEANQRTEEVDKKIEEAKESVSEQNVEQKESELSPEQKYDKNVEEFNSTVNKLIAFDKHLDETYERSVKEAGLASAEESEKIFSASEEKILQVEDGKLSEIVLNESEKKVYKMRKDYFSEVDIVEPQQKDLREQLKVIGSEARNSFNGSEKMLLNKETFKSFKKDALNDYYRKVEAFYKQIDPENKMDWNEAGPKGKVASLKKEMSQIVENTSEDGFKKLNENYNLRLNSSEYESLLRDSIQKIDEIKNEIDKLIAESTK